MMNAWFGGTRAHGTHLAPIHAPALRSCPRCCATGVALRSAAPGARALGVGAFEWGDTAWWTLTNRLRCEPEGATGELRRPQRRRTWCWCSTVALVRRMTRRLKTGRRRLVDSGCCVLNFFEIHLYLRGNRGALLEIPPISRGAICDASTLQIHIQHSSSGIHIQQQRRRRRLSGSW
jgi:hypothetical protein